MAETRRCAQRGRLAVQSARLVRVASVAALALTLVVLAGCRKPGLSRDEVRNRWVDTYVSELGLSESEAGCIVDRWFAELSDDELKPLTKGDELNDEQLQRFGELAVACGVGPDTPGEASST